MTATTREASVLPIHSLGTLADGGAAAFPFATNRTEPLAVVEAEHRKHAVVELRDPRSQRPGARAIPGGPVHRERRLDGDRRARAQPAALDRRPGPARPDHPRRPH